MMPSTFLRWLVRTSSVTEFDESPFGLPADAVRFALVSVMLTPNAAPVGRLRVRLHDKRSARAELYSVVEVLFVSVRPVLQNFELRHTYCDSSWPTHSPCASW